MLAQLRLSVLALAVGLASAGCTTVEPVGSSAPLHMELYCVGFLGESFSVRSSEGRIEYLRSELDSRRVGPRTVRPTAESWERFWSEMDEIDLWSWRSEYLPPSNVEIFDGTQWRVSVQYSGRDLMSRGDNAYPSDADPEVATLDPGNRFRRFTEAVEELIGEDFR